MGTNQKVVNDMLKSSLIDRLAQKQVHLTVKDISLAINSIVDLMIDTLSKNERIEIRGFGSFALRYRKPRRAHNPKTGQKLRTKPKYAVHFKPGKEMREKVNASSHLPIIPADDE
jgi:integration host factor subunit beta